MKTASTRRNSRERGTGSVYRRSDGYWIGEVAVAGKRRRVTAKTEELAALRLDELLRTAGTMPSTDWDGKTVGSWLRYWLAQTEVKPVTRFGYQSIVENHLLPAIGAVRVAELRPSHVRALLSELERKGRSPSTQRNVRNCLSAAMEMAREDGHIDSNPARVKVRDARYKTQVVASKDRFVKILDAIQHHRYACLYYVLVYTGMRIGEATALRWSDLDWQLETLEIRRSVTREPLPDDPRRSRKIISDTKTGRPRTLAVPSQLMMMLRIREGAEVKRMDLPGGTNLTKVPDLLMFPSKRNASRPLDSSHALHAFQTAMATAGVRASDGGPLRLHECRHLYATWQLGAGTDVATVSRLLGHSTPTTTVRFYAGINQGADFIAAAKMSFFEPSPQELAAARTAEKRRSEEYQPGPSNRPSARPRNRRLDAGVRGALRAQSGRR